MKLSVAVAVIGVILIVLGVLIAVPSVSTSTETIKEIQIDVQNHNGTYYGDYLWANKEDNLLINVSASDSDTFFNLTGRNLNTFIYGNFTFFFTQKGSHFQRNVALPYEGDYRIEISAHSGVVSANGALTQTRVVTHYSQTFNYGAGSLYVGALLAPGGLSIYGYQQVKLELEKRRMEKTRGIFSGRLLAGLELTFICGGFLLTLIFGLFPPLESFLHALDKPIYVIGPSLYQFRQSGFPLAWLGAFWAYGNFQGYSIYWLGFLVDFLFWALLTAGATFIRIRNHIRDYIREKKAPKTS